MTEIIVDSTFKVIRPHKKDEFDHSWEICTRSGGGIYKWPYVERVNEVGNPTRGSGDWISLRCPRHNLFDPFNFGEQVVCWAEARVKVTSVPMVYDD